MDALRGRVLVVLSGNGATRVSYRASFGVQPAMAVNGGGQVVLAYRSPSGDLRCWSGQADGATGEIAWYRKSTYAVSPYTVSEPALAINDDGWVVSVYRVGPQPVPPPVALLECRVGRVQEDGREGVNRRIRWQRGPDQLSAGLNPSLTIDGDDVRLIHETGNGKGRRDVRGTLDRRKQKVVWRKGRPTDSPFFDRDRATWQGHALRALANQARMILFSVDGRQRAVGFRQVAFVERQKGDLPPEIGDALFFAADAGSRHDIAEARNQRIPSRAWWFHERNRTDPPSPPQENAAATDTPYDQWYADYMDGGQTVW